MSDRTVRIDDEFEAKVETIVVVRLYRNGQVIVDTDGRPVDYASIDDAAYIARNWSAYGGDTPLQDLSDAELERRARRVHALDQER